MKRVRLSGRFVKKSKLQKLTKGREALLNFHENKEKSCDSENETKFGLASTFKIECENCLQIIHIYTPKRIYGKKSAKALFDVNCRIALACIDAGFGHDPLIRFFENIDIPSPTTKTLKTVKNEMGEGFVTVAMESFKKAI
ncbi:hypothetical protein PV326_005534 [Microctonus aethiopoides]|nr:hypothetical protein PV326_005534 [Microctonus aethiopoides]